MYIIRPPQPIHLVPQIRPQPDGRRRVTRLQRREPIPLGNDRREVRRQLFKIELLLIPELDDAAVRGGVGEEGVGGVEEGFCGAAILSISICVVL